MTSPLRARRDYGEDSYPTIYGCVMAMVPDGLADKILAFAQVLPKERIITEKDWTVLAGRAHVTVKYGILNPNPAVVADALIGVKPFVIRIGKLSVFYTAEEVVLKLAAESEELRATNRLLSRCLGNEDKHWDYQPHLTIAYLKPDAQDKYWFNKIPDDEFDGYEFAVDALVYNYGNSRSYIPLMTGLEQRIASRRR